MRRHYQLIAGVCLAAVLLVVQLVWSASSSKIRYDQMGRHQLEQGHYREAISFYQASVLWYPADPDGYFGLGQALHLVGDEAAAAEAFDQGFLIDRWSRDRIGFGPGGERFEVVHATGTDPVCDPGPAGRLIRLRQGVALRAGPGRADHWDAVICILTLQPDEGAK